jgi:uncharacterized membrane protein (GlpM family)
MPFYLKLLLTNLIILTSVYLGRKFPTLSGLIATMPLTTLVVLLWLAAENPGDRPLLTRFTGGVFWGIFPTLLFFATAWYCLRRGTPLPLTLLCSFAGWLLGAVVHQSLLK